MDFDALLTPDAKQAEGVWIHHADSEMEFKVASVRQKAYQEFCAQRYNAARRGRRDIPPEAATRILVDGVLRFILKDWRPKAAGRGFVTKEGAAVPFNRENASLLLNAESNEAGAIRDFIVEEAQNDFNFTSAELDGAVGRDAEVKEAPATAADVLKSGASVEPAVG